LSFLFLHVYFKFGFANSRDCKHTFYEHPQIYFGIFRSMQNQIVKSGIMEDMVSLDIFPHMC
jgi:hypothetical protein